MKYKNIPELSSREIEEALNSNNKEKISEAILALALYSSDFTKAQNTIIKYAESENPDMQFIAIQSISHLARRFKKIDQARVVPILRKALYSLDKDIAGTAEDVIDDLSIFVKDFSEKRVL